MQMQVKALCNLLRREDSSGEPWQLTDYRSLSLEEIFHRLKSLGVDLNEESFLIEAEPLDTPEELVRVVTEENEQPVYLLLFELWRRLLPGKESISIFCDALDQLIEQYEKKPIGDALQKKLDDLHTVLEENHDIGGSPHDIFAVVSSYSSYDLQMFLFDYIEDQIDAGHTVNAADMIEDFYPYVGDPVWFDLLRARLLSAKEPHEANLLFKTILEHIEEHPDLDLLLEMASFLVHHGDPQLFQETVSKAFELLRTEEDFQELVAIIADYYGSVDKTKEEKALQNLFARRSKQPLGQNLNKEDPDVLSLATLLQNPKWSEI
ncbi:MAG: hypothetical protein JSR58_02390 [Verrucomicrobia bacterium]|nr:hypothetical protein [Verrucomicrobiota bacterium]